MIVSYVHYSRKWLLAQDIFFDVRNVIIRTNSAERCWNVAYIYLISKLQLVFHFNVIDAICKETHTMSDVRLRCRWWKLKKAKM